MDWVAWTLVGVAALAFAVGAWAVRGDPSRGRRRCPRCAYDMGGVTTLRCPECGRDARVERALFRTKRRWRTAGAGVVVCLASLVTLGATEVSIYTWMGLAPNSLLVPLAGTARFHEYAELELWERIRGPNFAGALLRRDALRRWQWRALAAKESVAGRDEGLRAIATWALTEPRTPAPMTPERVVDVLCDKPPHAAIEMYGALDMPALPECMNAVHRDEISVVRLTTGGPLGEVCAVGTHWALTSGGEVWVFSKPAGGEWRVIDRALVLDEWWGQYSAPGLYESSDGRVFVVIRGGVSGRGVRWLLETWFEVTAGGLRPVLDREAMGYHMDWCYPDAKGESAFARVGVESGSTVLEFDCRSSVLRGDRLDKPLWSHQGVARYVWRARANRFVLDEEGSAWSKRDLASRFVPKDLRFRERLLMEDIAAGLRSGDASERERIEGIAGCFGPTGPGPRIKAMLEASRPAR